MNWSFPVEERDIIHAALQALVSLSTIGTQPDLADSELADKCKAEMAEWFGRDEVASWQLLRVYRIPFAQPNQVT